MTKCIKCNKALKKIGTERKNGTTLRNHNGKDWEDRQLHKKCWKELKETQDMYLFQMNFTDEQRTQFIKEFKLKWGFKSLLK